MSSPRKEYVLGTDADELSRLGLQHRIWADAAVAAWKRAGIGPGSRVMDVGCGPGYATFDLAQMVTESGHILAIDESQGFVEFLNSQAKARGVPQIQASVGDAHNLADVVGRHSEAGLYDAIYCRWVLCWLKDPAHALAGMCAALKPGGRVIIHDYFNWRAMTMAPRSRAVDKMILAAVDSFDERDADLDISARLPAMLRAAGFTENHFEVYQRVARGGGGDSTLAWPLSWWRTYGPKLVKMNKLSPEDMAQAEKDLDELERNPDQFFFCPPLFEFIATRTG
jgi:ubiquinone/menaquinone biosynthesis C-methylase UbiE